MRHSSFLEVNLGILGENFQKIKKLIPNVKILPMVKADAYGNGLVSVSRFLAQECGVKHLGCARLSEALRLFDACPELMVSMYVFSDTEMENETHRKAYLNYNITPVIHEASDLEIFLNDKDFERVPLVLKVNTGMNRLGLSLEEVEKYAPRLKNRGVQHLMSHLARSSEKLKAGDKSHKQLDKFNEARSILINHGVEIREQSLANSGAIEQGFATDLSYVRPGIMLYGPSSLAQGTWDGKMVSRLVTKVLKTFHVKKGTPVGYGVNVAPRDLFIVVLPIGYGDGINLSSTGVKVKINGFEGQVFARVNMDMLFVAFEPSVEGKIKSNDRVEFWSHDPQDITDMAHVMKTIPYEIMCGISGRIPRVYKVS
ncbi:MAG TPA: alanine racemase [Bacteriovoracaceae bacterium]|nr:alanine racemase [Bacteriovoracaceae bacterium]